MAQYDGKHINQITHLSIATKKITKYHVPLNVMKYIQLTSPTLAKTLNLNQIMREQSEKPEMWDILL